jgi:hypothetical protein
MRATRARFVGVALVVCLFAIGMAAFLNYFKYKSTVGQIVKSRVLVIANDIENSVQASLALGLSFSEIGMLPSLLKRDQLSDRLILGIDIFETSGKVAYSTDNERVGRQAPATWLDAAQHAKTREWSVGEKDELVAGILLKNNFDLTMGYLALRYPRAYVDRAASAAGRQLLIIALSVFVCAAILAPLALMLVIRGFERDIGAVENAVLGLESGEQAQLVAAGPFGLAVEQFRTSIQAAEAALAEVRGKLAARN